MKRSLRSEVRKRLANMPEQEFHLKAEAIHRKSFQSNSGKSVCYCPYGIQKSRSTDKPIIEQARLEGKRCAFRNVCLKQKDALSQLSG
ncbi:hypothetical protein PO124_08325 [Bacillus licheniformis]|nr:hypothetical protein [Bacillus licheniformis]